jgi:lipopolysaccharide transport system ATP-binding protein
MSEVAIRASGLGKQYRLGQAEQYQALRDVIARTVAAPFRRNGRRERPAGPDRFWALREISFEIGRGEAVAIVGRNGAGKSTLLKLLSRIAEPTEGWARVEGRVGSLLEVGTGFHPELTGRENVYLNGAILGMRRREIDARFDEIIAFAETESFVDTPVKRYSSGMYMRLAFAVAAHLEPEILIVDEVLAVGDAAFQKKCLGKMGDVTHAGRTVLFVSHNLDAVQRLCPRAMLLDGGRLVTFGPTPRVVAHYLSAGAGPAAAGDWHDLSAARRVGSGEARFNAVRYTSGNPAAGNRPYTGGPLDFTLDIISDRPRRVESLALTIYSQGGSKLIDADSNALGRAILLEEGHNEVTLRLETLHLNPGLYRAGFWLADPIRAHRSRDAYDFVESALDIEVVGLEDGGLAVKAEALIPCPFSVSQAKSAAEVSR